MSPWSDSAFSAVLNESTSSSLSLLSVAMATPFLRPMLADL